MTEELLPCPRCNGKSEIWHHTSSDYYSNGSYYAICADGDDCGISGEHTETPEGAAAWWNRRASPWISVEERLPTFAGRFLVQMAIADRDFSIADFAFFSPIYGNWVIFDDRYEGGSVTHWMPIPNLPKEKEEA